MVVFLSAFEGESERLISGDLIRLGLIQSKDRFPIIEPLPAR
jgi:hypothetical protein